jgi:hypothetical protein
VEYFHREMKNERKCLKISEKIREYELLTPWCIL